MLMPVADAALLRYHQIMTLLPRPSPRDVDILANNLEAPQFSDYLLGLDCTIWKDKATRRDLVSVNNNPGFDILTKGLIAWCLQPYYRLVGGRESSRKGRPNADADLFHYEDSHLMIPASILSVVLVALLPVLSIVVLYNVHSTSVRLALLAVFTAVFSASVAVLGKANRFEVFASAAA